MFSGVGFAVGLGDSEAQTFPGQLADGMKGSAKTILRGAAIGGAPVTYPTFKAYEYASNKMRQ